MEKVNSTSGKEEVSIHDRVKKLEKRVEEWNGKFNFEFNLEDNIVFNKDLDNINEDMNIKYIILGDNPGNDEKKQKKYFYGEVGQEFRDFLINELKINIEKEVIFLNKTLISTGSTDDLKGNRKELKNAEDELKKFEENISMKGNQDIEYQEKISELKSNIGKFKSKKKFSSYKEIQECMAQFTFFLHNNFPNAEVWVTGGINNSLFNSFFNELNEVYSNNNKDLFKKVLFFNHFSNKNFEYDFLKRYYNKTKEKFGIPYIEKTLRELGEKNKNEKIEKQKELSK